MSGSRLGPPPSARACNRPECRLQVLASSIRRLDCDAGTAPALAGRGAALSRPALGQPPSLSPDAEAARMPSEHGTPAQLRSELLESLMRARGAALRRQAFRHSESAEAAEEALQDAAVQFLRRFEGEDADYALGWMMTTVKRCAWRITRRSRRHPSFALSTTGALPAPGEEGFTALDDRPGPELLALRHAEQAQTVAAFERLKPDERTALLMLGLGCSYREIQDHRGWTRTKVNRCLAEGRAAVRCSLEDGG
jgi:DNA-directed RNA polymerase specialized sigma24 family protein